MAIQYLSAQKCKLIVSCGYDAKGRQIRRCKTVTYTSQRNAEKQYRAFEAEVLAGAVSNKSIKLEKLMDDVISSLEQRGRKPTTIKGYKAIKSRVIDTLGNPQAGKLTTYDIDRWIEELIAKDYAPKTIHSSVRFLSECFDKGIKWKLLSTNPCSDAELPRMRVKNQKVVLDETTIKPFLTAVKECEDIDVKVMLELALLLGLRRSEILGLTVHDIDLEDGIVSVRGTRHRVGKDDYNDDTKTEGSTRVLAMPESLRQDIEELIAHHEDVHERYKTSSDYLILDQCGEPPKPNTAGAWVRAFTESNGLPSVSLHGLRHTHATLIHHLGHELTEISSQLGHTVQSTTLNVYMHMFRGASAASRSIANDLENLLQEA